MGRRKRLPHLFVPTATCPQAPAMFWWGRRFRLPAEVVSLQVPHSYLLLVGRCLGRRLRLRLRTAADYARQAAFQPAIENPLDDQAGGAQDRQPLPDFGVVAAQDARPRNAVPGA